MNHRTRKTLTISTVLFLLGIVTAPTNIMAQISTTYKPTWASVNTHVPAPDWFKDAKLGIYFHWGVYSVPAWGYEWYPKWMYDSNSRNANSKYYRHHLAAYGDPFTTWPYHNFIKGANDKQGVWTQFAPKLVSAGGKFDPDAWAQLFVDAGAKYAGPVAEHCDGYSMWNSTCNQWNAVKYGPKLDLVDLLTSAIRRKNLKVVTTMHHAYTITRNFFGTVPRQTDTALQKLYCQRGKTIEQAQWLAKEKEVIDRYQPDMLWHDVGLDSLAEPLRLELLAHYYNMALDWKKEVLVTYKDGFNTLGEVRDFERGGPAGIVSPYWLTDDAISETTWSYIDGIIYYSSQAIMHSFIDRVSKNGSLLLDIAPMADGTIPQAQKDILLAMGGWLGKFGESIYATRAWTVFGQGPTKMGGGSGFSAPIAGTAKDIRFTVDKANTALYAIFLGWPGNGATVTIDSINSSTLKKTVTGASLLGPAAGASIPLTFAQNANGFRVTFPAAQPFTALAYALKLSFVTSGTERRVDRAASPLFVHHAMLQNGSVRITATLPSAGTPVAVTITDVRGRVVFTKAITEPAGTVVSVDWDNAKTGAGMYIIDVRSEGRNCRSLMSVCR